ncbi:MAG: peptidylprolyl isomerase [Paracoccaceae bacterium]
MLRLGIIALAVLLSSWAFSVDRAHAQGQFSPELQIGNAIVTRYQVDQRTQFLTLLGAPGETRGLARQQLISEALQLEAARIEGIEVVPAALEAAITEFAARANLTPEQFRQIVASRGISEGTVRDFFTAGVAWRETVRARFGSDIRAAVSGDDARRALAQTGTQGGLRLLLSEILLPATDPATIRASEARAGEIAQIRDEDAFEAAARRFSVAGSAARGGALDWVAIETLPPEVRATVERLSPGQISRPVRLEEAIAIYLLREEETVSAGAPETFSIDYALFTVTGGPTEAAVVAAQVDVCDDFYGIAQGLPETRLIRETKPAGALPADLRAALSGLDEGETSTAVTRNGNATVAMLCQRQPDTMNTVDLTIAGNRLLNVRLGTAASHYLAQLRANANIIDFTTN